MTEEQEKRFDELIAKFDLFTEEELDRPINEQLKEEIIEFLNIELES